MNTAKFWSVAGILALLALGWFGLGLLVGHWEGLIITAVICAMFGGKAFKEKKK